MVSPLSGAVCPTGGKLGNKGGGRRPEKLVHFLAELRQAPDFHDALQKAAFDPDCRGFASVLRLLGEYDDSKPAEKKQVEGSVAVRVVVQREGRRQTR
jgi:hypothetical protein